MIFVPAAFTADAILEAVDAGIKVVVAITEGVPVLDMVRVYDVIKRPQTSVWSAPTAPASSRPRNARSASCPATSTRRARSA